MALNTNARKILGNQVEDGFRQPEPFRQSSRHAVGADKFNSGRPLLDRSLIKFVVLFQALPMTDFA